MSDCCGARQLVLVLVCVARGHAINHVMSWLPIHFTSVIQYKLLRATTRYVYIMIELSWAWLKSRCVYAPPIALPRPTTLPAVCLSVCLSPVRLLMWLAGYCVLLTSDDQPTLTTTTTTTTTTAAAADDDDDDDVMLIWCVVMLCLLLLVTLNTLIICGRLCHSLFTRQMAPLCQ